MTAETGRRTKDRRERPRPATGLMQIGVTVRREDADLLRALARALRDPAQNAGIRAALHTIAPDARAGFKATLEAAPLEGVVLERSPGGGRAVDL